MIEYFNEDCLIGMARYPDKYFELAITDPPYNIVSKQKRGIGSRIDPSGKMNDWNHIKPTKEYFDELFRVSKYQIIWGANNFILPESEYFIVWDKHQTVDNFASAELAYTNCKMPAKVFRYSVHQMMNDQTKIHPTQKPVALYKWLLTNYAKQGYKILDTHVGSASSLIACYDMGFDAVGFELDKDYYEQSKARLEYFMKQPKITDIVVEQREQQTLF